MDTSVLPLGERARRAVLDHVVAAGDAAETSYLEVKSEIDLTRPAGVTKVAKFLLGAANRAPEVAGRHFQGYAVMVLGAGPGGLSGLPRGIEPHELEDRLRPYLGTGFPVYELGRLPADDPSREVLFVFAAPPVLGQPPYPCRRDFQGAKAQENLQDGAIYVRGQSNTRPASSGEVDALVDRARAGSRPEVELDVEVRGPVHRILHVEELVGRFYERTEQKFREALGSPEPRRSTVEPSAVFGATQPVSVQERRDRLQRWLDARPGYAARGREHLLGVLLQGMKLSVTSRGRFVAGPRLTVVFHDCWAVEHLEGDDFDPHILVEPVLGRRQDPYSWVSAAVQVPLPANYPVHWEVSDKAVQVTLSPDSLHPDAAWVSDDDDFCVVVSSDQPTVRVTWLLTEQDNDKVYRGDLQVAVNGSQDAFALFRDFRYSSDDS